MERKITQKLKQWKISSNRKPLLIRGARQVGKTYTILEFGQLHFNGNIHLFNFEKNPEYHAIFEQNLESNRILSELELVLNKKIVPGEDLLFFDEIQECPNALMSLRYFYEENPALHVIAAGSLLEFAFKDISFPVGRIQMLFMHPMNFEEFLIANDKKLLAEKIIQAKNEFSDSVIQMVNNELYKYFIIGGMPECVSTFIESGSFVEAITLQTDLIATYRQDFSKYSGHADKRCLSSVFNSVAKRTGEQIIYSKLDENYTNPTIKKAFELLETARLFSKVKATSPSSLPLGANTSERKFKTVFLDIGLLSNFCGFYSDKTVSKQKFASAYNGKMAEQFVGQELRTSFNLELFYWSREARGSSAETDYLIETNGDIVPIEVKSGKSGSLKSLHLLLDSFPNVEKAIVFTEDKYGQLTEKGIKFLPLFHAGSIAEKT